jgi:hypothetical protein
MGVISVPTPNPCLGRSQITGPERASLYFCHLVKCMASVLSASSRRSSYNRLSLKVLKTTDSTAALCDHVSLGVFFLQDVMMRPSLT